MVQIFRSSNGRSGCANSEARSFLSLLGLICALSEGWEHEHRQVAEICLPTSDFLCQACGKSLWAYAAVIQYRNGARQGWDVKASFNRDSPLCS
mmetsp:Transcript_119608/g.284105  ORF Transcript_119608/g.284105 Transcript_119608/m.284105 type:complete len:94 (-) Transcript_119608:100-381(-)